MSARSGRIIIAVSLGILALVAGFGLHQPAAQPEEKAGAEPLADVMSRQLEDVQAIIGALVLADRAKVEENGNRLANEALSVAATSPKKRAQESATYKYLAYKVHVNAREVAGARSPKLAQEKLAEALGACVDCHHLFRD
ncbi:MAG: hypothetical protein ACE5O2_01345 [Armatimonadota bacterium]